MDAFGDRDDATSVALVHCLHVVQKCFKDEDGEVLRWFGTNTDISLQKDAEGALERSEVQLRQAVAAGGGIGTWHWDIKADRITADDTFADICGVDRDLARSGVPIEEFFIGIAAVSRSGLRQSLFFSPQLSPDPAVLDSPSRKSFACASGLSGS